MMEDKKIAEYFIVAGLPPDPQPLDEYSDDVPIKPTYKQDPIVDIAVINKTLGENPPSGYQCVEFTPNGFPADLNHGSLRAHEMSICYRRGRDKPSLTDIGILLDSKEGVKSGCEVLLLTPGGNTANVNNSNNSRIYITYRRADETSAADTLAVTDICVILANKGETPPHTFYKIDKNLNRAMVGSDVFLCYKKSMAKPFMIPYKPAILDRYPSEDSQSTPLPERVSMFCLPVGASLESWPAKSCHPEPQFSTFVLTMEAWEKLYGASISFYEEINSETLSPVQRQQLGLTSMEQEGADTANTDKTVHVSKCLCILSRWPFFDTFKRYLSYVYHMSTSGPHDVPLERVIYHFMSEVPFPSPQRPRILVQFSGSGVVLSQPEDSPVPQSGASFTSLLQNLGSDNCITLLLLTLLENKILIHSLRHAVLTSVAEAVANMIFPLHWQCPYIPLCPLELSGMLSAPTPFLVGLDSRYFDLFDPPSDVVCVDLDANFIILPEEKKNVSYKMLPKKATKVLRATLDKLYAYICQQPPEDSSISSEAMLMDIDQEFKDKRKQLIVETCIQEAFLRFMAVILKGYNHHLLPIIQAPTVEATDRSSLFDIQGFLKSRDKANHKFFSQMLNTQLFSRFIEERSFVSDKDVSLAFFDDCTEKVGDGAAEPRLLEIDDSHNSERTVFIPPPDTSGLPPDVTYSYKGVPALNYDFFPQKAASTVRVNALKSSQCANSPMMTRRTKQELKSAQRTAQKQQTNPALWAKCLLSHCYSLWFIHLPSYVKCTHSKNKSLRTAYDVLVKMQSAKLQPPDEVCYRVLLQLCSVYHQPVLAVKLLFDMRNNGIQPNAITYGFYNKAVLESKWPTSDTNAYQLWTKVKHVVGAVAQFKQALKNRRHSVYSNSESESDQISRTSTDSFLDEMIPPQDKQDYMASRSDAVMDHVNVESPNDERISTGALSDKGYSSMTLEDAGKRSSLIIGSQDSLDSLGKRKSGVGSSGEHKVHKRTVHKQSASVSAEAIDPKTDTDFQEKIGSIVRKSAGSLGSSSTLRSSTCSNAGLLMTSQSSVDESVFSDHSLGIQRSPPSDNIKRHKKSLSQSAADNRRLSDKLAAKSLRHKSANVDRRASAGVASGLQSEEVTPRNSTAIVDDMCGASGDRVNNETTVSQCVQSAIEIGGGDTGTSDGQETDEKRTSIVKLDSITRSPQLGVDCSKDGTENVHNNGEEEVVRDDGILENESRTVSEHVCSTTTHNELHSSSSSKPFQGSKDSLDRLSQSSSNSAKSITSPGHSIRTPVTENDPLGMFSVSSAVSSSGTETPDIIVNSNALISSSESRSASDVLKQPFGGASTPVKSLFKGSTNARGSSSSSELGSPIRQWKPLSSSDNLLDKTESDQVPENKSSTLPRLSEAPVRSMSHGRNVGRSESFMKSVKSAAGGWISSKFSQIKESTTGTPVRDSANTGSTQSLPIDYSSQKQAEPLGMPDTEELLQNMPPDDARRGRFKQLKGYTPFVTDFLSGVMQSPAMKSVQKGLTSVKDSLVESWAISDSEDEDEYYQRRKYSDASSQSSQQRASEEYSNGKGSAPPHSVLDQYLPLSDDVDSDKGSFQVFGSVQSLQQVFFNTAMEVEICSLSRCNSCSGLLYDEEIMAGWSFDDSNLNTSCQFCGSKVVPSLQIYVKDFRQFTEPQVVKASQSVDSMQSMQSIPGSGVNRHTTGSSTTVPAHFASHMQPAHFHASESDLPAHAQSALLATPPQTKHRVSRSPNRTPTNQVSRSAENLLDNSICDVINDTPVPTMGRVSRTSNIKAIEIRDTRSAGNSVEASPAHSLPSTPAKRTSLADSTLPNFDQGNNKDADHVDGDENVDAAENPTQDKSNKLNGIVLDPVTVPYLSPLVLRKELETVISREGDFCLTKPEFVDEHPIIYWNMLYYFKRLDVDSHLPGFILAAKTTNNGIEPAPKAWAKADSRHVQTRAVWDNLRVQDCDIGKPMYITYFESPPASDTVNALITEAQVFSKGTLQHMVQSVMYNDVVKPIRMVMNERRKQKHLMTKGRFRSLYRDILFLAFTVLGRENIDHDAFDREFRLAYSCLSKQEMARLRTSDRPPNRATVCCRKVFGDLEL